MRLRSVFALCESQPLTSGRWSSRPKGRWGCPFVSPPQTPPRPRGTNQPVHAKSHLCCFRVVIESGLGSHEEVATAARAGSCGASQRQHATIQYWNWASRVSRRRITAAHRVVRMLQQVGAAGASRGFGVGLSSMHDQRTANALAAWWRRRKRARRSPCAPSRTSAPALACWCGAAPRRRRLRSPLLLRSCGAARGLARKALPLRLPPPLPPAGRTAGLARGAGCLAFAGASHGPLPAGQVDKSQITAFFAI